MKKYEKYINKKSNTVSLNLVSIYDLKDRDQLRKVLELYKLFDLEMLFIEFSVLKKEIESVEKCLVKLSPTQYKQTTRKKFSDVSFLIDNSKLEEMINMCIKFNTTCIISNIKNSVVNILDFKYNSTITSDFISTCNDENNNIISFDLFKYDLEKIESKLKKIL